MLVKDALADVSPMLFLALRFSLAALVLAAILLPKIYRRKLQRASLRDGAVAGTLLFLGYLFQTTGLQYTTASKSAFYTSLSIPMVPLLASLVYRSAPRWNEAAGIAVSSTGMILLTTEGSRVAWDRGSLLSFFCAVAFAGHIVAVGKFADRSNFETLAVMQILTAAVLSGVTFRFIDTVKLRWSGSVIAAVLVTALLATALAFTIQAWAQQHTTATRTALIYTLEPVWACITSWLLRGERLSGIAWIGGLLILAGVLLVELKRNAGREHPSVRVVSPEV